MAQANEAPVDGDVAFRAMTLRGTQGFFRAGQDAAGRWWLMNPRHEAFFARCVHGVTPAPPQGDGALPCDSAAQLRAWGFNSVGVTSGVGGDDDLPFLRAIDFCRAGRVVQASELRLPDVFDPEWPRQAMVRAREVCGSLAESRALIGWMTDDTLAWAQGPRKGRPSLLQHCLSLEPSFAAYHAAWEFVLALHGGRLDSLARAWGVEMKNKEVVRELTRGESGIATRGYLRDHARWTREFARRYFTTSAAAVRAVDSNHLLFGCRFRDLVGADVLAECVYPAVDVAMPDWRELPATGAGALHPFLAGEVCWVQEEFLRAAASDRGRRLTSVERMIRGARVALERVARHPAAIGFAWGQWQDEPGEQPPFARGLLHVNGAEAREHTELLTQFNLRAENLRRKFSTSIHE